LSLLRLRRLKQQHLHAACPQSFYLIESDVEIVRPADRLEFAGRDEIENLAGIDAEDGRLVMDFVMNGLSRAVFVDIRWTASTT